jgi:hypothetical protein
MSFGTCYWKCERIMFLMISIELNYVFMTFAGRGCCLDYHVAFSSSPGAVCPVWPCVFSHPCWSSKSRQAFWTSIWLKQSLSDPFLIYHLLSLSNQIRVINALQLTKKFYRVFFTHKRSCGNFFHRKYNSTWSLISELHPYYV